MTRQSAGLKATRRQAKVGIGEAISEAVIYLRVSDKGQVENGNGLESQETTCRE